MSTSSDLFNSLLQESLKEENFKNNILIFIERFLAKKSTKIIAISKLQSHDLIYKYKICSLYIHQI